MSAMTSGRPRPGRGWARGAAAFIGLLLALATLGPIGAVQANTVPCDVMSPCLTGTITPPPGVAAEDLMVAVVYRVGDRYETSVQYVAADGSYETRLPLQRTWIVFAHKGAGMFPDGTFAVSGNVAPTYYDGGSGAYTLADATPLEPTTGARFSIDLALAPAATLAGTVSFVPAASPGEEFWVELERRWTDGSWAPWGSAQVDMETGTFQATGLLVGEYRARVGDFYWPGGVPAAQADSIPVPGTGAVTGIDLTFRYPAKPATISGTVTTQPGVPVRGTVELHRWNEAAGSWGYHDEVNVRSGGTFVTSGLPEGRYKLRFYDYTGALVDEWWKDAATLADATPVDVTDGHDVTGMDFVAAARAMASGRVTSAHGVRTEGFVVKAEPVSGPGETRSAVADSSGDYTIHGLEPGDYRVSFEDIDELHLRQFWQDAALAADATPVTITERGELVTGVDAVLDIDTSKSFSVSVTVTGTPMVGSPLQATARIHPSGGATSYQWLAGGTEIPGATSATYTPTTNDVGKTLTVRVVAAGYGLKPGTGTSAPTAPVMAPATTSPSPSPTASPTVTPTESPTASPTPSAAPPTAPVPAPLPAPAPATELTAVSKPKVAGTSKVGSTLKVTAGTWSVPVKVTYQWLVDGKAVKKATKPKFRLTQAQRGKKIAVRLVAKAPGLAPVRLTVRFKGRVSA